MVKINSNFDELYTSKDSLPSIFSYKSFITVWLSNADYICDGVNDHVEIQQAIDYAEWIGGGTVLLAKATYNISYPMTLKAWVSLVWVSKTGTILKWATWLTGWVIYQWATYIASGTLSDLTIDANSISNVSWIQIYRSNGLSVRNIICKNIVWVWGMLFGSYSGWVSYDLTIDNIVLDSVTGTSLEGLLIYNVEHFSITNNKFTNCECSNTCAVSIYLLSKNGTVSGNYFENSNDSFGLLDITGSNNVVVTGNTFNQKWTNGGGGIILHNNKDITIGDNTFKSNNNTGRGIYMIDWSSTIDWHTIPYPNSLNLAITGNIINGFYYPIIATDDDGSKNNARENVSIVWNQLLGYNFAWIAITNFKGDIKTHNISNNIFTPTTSGDKRWVYIVGNATHGFKKSIISGNIITLVSGQSDCIDLTYANEVQVYGNMNTPNGAWVAVKQTSCTSVTVV